MKKRPNTFSALLLQASLILVCMNAHADDPRNGHSLPDDAIRIVNLNDEDFSVDLRNCLKHKTLAQCLNKELGVNANVQKPKSPVAKAENSIDSSITGAWRQALQNSLGVSENVWSNSSSFFTSLGFLVGGNRIDMDQILLDPNKVATDQKLGGNSVWVKHEFQLLPGLGYGINPGGLATPFTMDGWYGGTLNYNMIMRITKRHVLDKVYNKDFWGYFHSDTQIMKQAFPMYFTIGRHFNGQELLPGEGLELEHYGLVQLAFGPTFNLIPIPGIPFGASAGIFANADLVGSYTFGLFRTTMEAQKDGKLRITLENINEGSHKFLAQINAGFALGPISFIHNLVSFEAGKTTSADTIYDMVIDPNISEALKALHEAYRGNFALMKKLADEADFNYQGVHEFAKTHTKEVAHDYDFKFLGYDRGANTAQSHLKTHFNNDPTSTKQKDDKDVIVDSMLDHRSTFKSNNSLLLYISTDKTNPDPKTNRSLSLKYRFSSKEARPNEIKQFVDLARLLAPANRQNDVDSWESFITSPQNTKDKTGKFQGYFYISFDPTTVSALLDPSNNSKNSKLLVNWATALNLPNAAQWGTMSDSEQDLAALAIPGLPAHLSKFRNFLQAIQKAVAYTDQLKQSKVIVTAMRNEDFDLYPIAALAPADHSHLMVLQRMTLNNKAIAEPLEYAAFGDDYIYPKKTLHE